MRKWTRMLLLAGLFTVLLCSSALAAGESGGIHSLDPADKLVAQTANGTPVTETTSSGGNEVYAGTERVQFTLNNTDATKQYLVFVLKGETSANPTPTDANIVYIDQQAGTGGDLQFNLYPSTLVSGTTYGIYVSATDQTLTKAGSFGYYVPYKLGHVVSAPDKPITVLDARAALQMSAGIGTWTETQKLAANVDGKGNVDVIDARNILRASAGLSANFDY